MNNHGVGPLLEALRSPDSCGNAWTEFLEFYSPVLYQSARAYTSNNDAAADCYLHICERLSANGFRRLLKFKPEGSASFTTWLRVVARNLCFDWHRSQSGRQRPFKSQQHLTPVEREVYNSRFVRGLSSEETLHRINAMFAGAALSDLSDIEERLQHTLTSRQQWILRARWQEEFDGVANAGSQDDGEPLPPEIADPRPNQEELLAQRQLEAQLQQRLAELPSRDRLLLQLRFEQELSLEEIARLCGLGDAQRAHRALAAILTRLRPTLEQSSRKTRSRVRGIKQETGDVEYQVSQRGEGR